MAYNTIDDILGEISGEILVQLADDGYTGITAAMVALAAKGESLSALTPEEAVAAVETAANVGKALVRASALVDGYCSNLYDVPFASPTDFLRAIDLDIAVYNLFSRRESVPENRKDRNANAVKVLQGIAKGDIQMGASAKTAPQQVGQNIRVSTPSVEIFTPTRLKNY